jgi:excisionase family DNA binding protein
MNANLSFGPEVLDAIAERLKPSIKDALAQAMKGLMPPTPLVSNDHHRTQAPKLPDSTGVEVSIEDRINAQTVKGEILKQNGQKDDRLLIDCRTAAHLLDVSTRTLYRLSSEGALPPAVKVGRLSRWRAEELKAWVDADCPLLKDWHWPQHESQSLASKKTARR